MDRIGGLIIAHPETALSWAEIMQCWAKREAERKG